ncbi:MAG: OmpA/MotB family protein [Fusobacteriaceae bacterium]
MKVFKKNRSEDGNHFLLSISDLMMAVLLIFVLLYMKEFISRIIITQKLVSIERTIAATKETQIKIQLIDKIHTDINQKLLKTFKNDKDIKVDTINQELILDDSVLFGINEWELKDYGKERLRKILPKFFSTFVDDKLIVKFLESLTIEGHTDDLGHSNQMRNYLYNLDLSQKRAYEVARFIYSDEFISGTLGEKRLSKLKTYISSNGKSNAKLIYLDDKSTYVDRAKSRRVTIRYRLDIQKLLNTPLEELKKYNEGSEK